MDVSYEISCVGSQCARLAHHPPDNRTFISADPRFPIRERLVADAPTPMGTERPCLPLALRRSSMEGVSARRRSMAWRIAKGTTRRAQSCKASRVARRNPARRKCALVHARVYTRFLFVESTMGIRGHGGLWHWRKPSLHTGTARQPNSIAQNCQSNHLKLPGMTQCRSTGNMACAINLKLPVE